MPWLEGAGRAGAGMAGPDPYRGVSWGVSDPNLVLFFPAQPAWRRVPTSGARASLGLQKGAGCAGALGPRCTSPLPARGPSPELIPEVAGSRVCILSRQRGKCLGPTSATSAFRVPALHSVPKLGDPWGQQRGTVA